jgi:hypothetical protein
MKHPQFIHRWRDFWDPPSWTSEASARETHHDSPSETRQALEAIEQERQRQMPPYWVSYAQIAGHIAVFVLVVGLIYYAI